MQYYHQDSSGAIGCLDWMHRQQVMLLAVDGSLQGVFRFKLCCFDFLTIAWI